MFKQLKIYYIFISLPFVLLLIGSTIFFDAIKTTITRNPHPQINYTIFTIIILGGILILLNSRRLMREARAIVEFSRAIHAKVDLTTLQEMANSYRCDISCLLQMVATSGDRSISHQEQAAIEHELTNAKTGLVRRNALPQYLTGLLVGMGLLGTFIGLLATLNDISVLISSFAEIDMQNASPLLVFRTMIERMKAPMQSMGIAFSASMFGLLGSIILGLMMVGVRRLQGDIFSLLSSEIARHIEIALSFESTSYRSADVPVGVVGAGEGGGDSGVTTKILLRIEERLAEAARLRQRALSAEIDDFKKQRADMLKTLSEQTEASNNFRGELQQLGGQLGSIFNSMEKNNSEISNQLSELTVHQAGAAKETHKLLAMQVDEQKDLRSILDSHQIEERERLAEAARMQQRTVSAEMEDFRNQRADMLRTLTEQTEASKNFCGELQSLGGQLNSIFNSMEKGNSEISNQLSELTINFTADAKESHILLNNANNSVRNGLQQLGGQLDSQLEALSNVTEQGNGEVCTQISTLAGQIAAETRESHQRLDSVNGDLREELQQLGSKLGAIAKGMERGDGEICTQISALTNQVAIDTRESNQQLASTTNALSGELQKLGAQLVSIANGMEQGNGEICTRIATLTGQVATDNKDSHQLLDGASSALRDELQQLGHKLATVSGVVEKGNVEICTHLTALAVPADADEGEVDESAGMVAEEATS